MEDERKGAATSSLRWGILRQALLPNFSSDTVKRESDIGIKLISRKSSQGFNLIPCSLVPEGNTPNHLSVTTGEACFCYTLPIPSSPKLVLFQRMENKAILKDFEICNRYDIDNTGLVCAWPSEEVLAYYCLSHADLFRSKKVIELGSGYGLAGLVIAMATDASEVVISDGNPQVVDYIQCNINTNSGAFGPKKVKSMMLHWNQEEILEISNTFDVIVASDCTFFKEFHKGLVQTLNWLLKKEGPCTAMFFSPKRGDSLDKFLKEVKESGLRFSIDEIYDSEVWRQHQKSVVGDLWPNYDKDHCYPLLVRIVR